MLFSLQSPMKSATRRGSFLKTKRKYNWKKRQVDVGINRDNYAVISLNILLFVLIELTFKNVQVDAGLHSVDGDASGMMAKLC